MTLSHRNQKQVAARDRLCRELGISLKERDGENVAARHARLWAEIGLHQAVTAGVLPATGRVGRPKKQKVFGEITIEDEIAGRARYLVATKGGRRTAHIQRLVREEEKAGRLYNQAKRRTHPMRIERVAKRQDEARQNIIKMLATHRPSSVIETGTLIHAPGFPPKKP